MMYVYAAVFLLLLIVVWEFVRGKMMTEGFTDGVVPEYFGRFFPRRVDVGPNSKEEGGWIRNPRYFEGYVDLQRLGYKGDFCRVIEKKDMPESRIVACALAGQEGLDPYTYRTESARAGTRFSRDDYFRDVNKDGREDYGRILKVEQAPNDRWEARAVLAGLTRFSHKEIPDNDPPPHIADLLWFFEGIMVWYRFVDDMLDYGENTQLWLTNGKMEASRGCTLRNQYIKIGENPQLEFDTKVQLRQLRAISVWVYFDEFTHNARILDFGNGAGRDNVLLGIEGKGNTNDAFMGAGTSASLSETNAELEPAEVTPQEQLDIDDRVPSSFPSDLPQSISPKANLLFEIWDTEQRKMRLKVSNVIPRKAWTHIAVTTTDSTSFRPTWQVYINGTSVFTHPDGHMPLKSYTTQNYLGRSNWETETSQYPDRDERLQGSLFDFRLYRTPMSATKIQKTVEWGKHQLEIK